MCFVVMHLMITKRKYKGRIIEHAKIVESYRENGKTPRKRTIFNLGTIKNEEDRVKFKQILNSIKEGNEFVNVKDLNIESSKEFGVTYTINKLLEKYGIQEILQEELTKNKAQFNIFGIIKALIINRLIKPSSDLSAYDWMKNDYSEKLDVKEHQVYRALDYFIERKDNIEKKIFESLKTKLNLNTDLIHYDLTSSYFEGLKCEIAFYGHSRDHRKDRKQIVIGLVMCDGIPIYHEVYEGNTLDKSTLKGMINNLKEKLGIKKAAIVADRGLITEGNLEMLEDEEYNFVLGFQRRNNKISKEYLVREINTEQQQFAIEVDKETIKRNNKEYVRRYILCLDQNTKKDRLRNLEEIKNNLDLKLMELKDKYSKSQLNKKGKKMTKESLILQAFKIAGKNKRLFEIKEDNGLKFSFKKESYEYEKNIAGKFLIVTNTEKSAIEIMKTYKELQIVENAFDEIKNFLDVRPLEHHKKSRVKAHVFVCVLGFLIESIIEKFSKESARKTLRKLERIKMIEIKIKGNDKKMLTMEALIEVKGIFKEIRIKEPSLLDCSC